MRTQHPLNGMLIRYNTEDGKAYCLSRLGAYLGQGLMLAQRLSPHDGSDLGVAHIVALGEMSFEEAYAEIYPDWETFERDMNRPRAAKVIKLVPKPEETGAEETP